MFAANSYDVRYSKDVEDLIRNFKNSQRVTNRDIVRGAGTLTAPKPSGNRETMDATLTDVSPDQTIYVGVKVKDNSNKQSDLSNIVKVHLVVPPTTTVKPEKPSNKSLVILLAVVISLIVVALIIIVILVVILVRRRRRKHPSDPPVHYYNQDVKVEFIERPPEPRQREGWRLEGLAED